MRVVIQRVSHASVKVDDKVVGQCGMGYMLLVGFTHADTESIIDKMIQKIIQLRICEDSNGKMNLSIMDVGGEILSVPQFTLYANCTEGRRPSFTNALEPTKASRYYDLFNAKLKAYGVKVEQGIFQSSMEVELVNMGPTTIILDSQELRLV